MAPSTQDQAFYALVYLYRHVIGRPLVGIDALRAKRETAPRVPLSVPEVVTLLASLRGQTKLICQVIYGCGLRVNETMHLRVRDIDFDRRCVIVTRSKSRKGRFVPLPRAIDKPLREQIEVVRGLHSKDEAAGVNRVELPYRQAEQSPQLAGDFASYWLFCSKQLSQHPVEGWTGRYHVDADNFRRNLKNIVRKTGITKHVYPHILRHSYATHFLEAGGNIVMLRDLLGHKDVKTTQIYVHATLDTLAADMSPLDRLPGLRER